MATPAKSALGALTIPGLILLLAVIAFFVVRYLGYETRMFDTILFVLVLILWLLCFVVRRKP